MSKKPTGGYFELELKKGNNEYHNTPYRTKSGRASVTAILNYLQPTLVYIPFFTCDSLIEPFEATGTKYTFYSIDEQLEPAELPSLKAGEYFLYVNYLDIKRPIVATLSEKYRERLIVDCTQAFFQKGNGVSWYFNSCRKFFGVPDGSYLYVPDEVVLPALETTNEDYTIDHLLMRFNEHSNEGYSAFQQNEEKAGRGLLVMSKLTEYLLSNIDYTEIAERRRSNYAFLNELFKTLNGLQIELTTENVPMSYPLVLTKKIEKSLLFKEHIFIPTFWKDTQNRNTSEFAYEQQVTDNLWPLPIDHRYTIDDMRSLHSAIMCILS